MEMFNHILCSGKADCIRIQQVQQTIQESLWLGAIRKIQVTLMKQKHSQWVSNVLFWFSDALPNLLEHISYIDRNITRPMREYNDCQVNLSFDPCFVAHKFVYRRLWSSAIVLKQIVIEQKAAKRKKKWLFESNSMMCSQMSYLLFKIFKKLV